MFKNVVCLINYLKIKINNTLSTNVQLFSNSLTNNNKISYYLITDTTVIQPSVPYILLFLLVHISLWFGFWCTMCTLYQKKILRKIFYVKTEEKELFVIIIKCIIFIFLSANLLYKFNSYQYLTFWFI